MFKDTEKIRKAMVALVTIVLLLSIILCFHSISGRGLIGCSQGTNCNTVLGSKWSFLFGIIPVSALAAGVWIAFLVCLILHSRNSDLELQYFLNRILLILSGAVTGSAAWFIWLQSHMIKAFCPYCMTAHILGILISVLTVIWCVRQKPGHSLLNIGFGLTIAVALAVVQFATTPLTLAERGFAREPLPELSPRELPVTGDPDAPHVITLLYDWQCSHCRKIHNMLPDVVDILSGRVAFILCPISLSRECNPLIPQGSTDRFTGSCQLLHIGLALWRTDPIAYSRYEEWYWGDPAKGWNPPSVDEATAYASDLIGADRLEQAIKDPWIESYMQTVLQIFGRTSSEGRSAVPRFIYNNDWLIPEADDAAGLASLVSEMTQ
ncbi:MAG: thioredoxin domain-containing protein [Bacteroidaceae bacterium]|nr:thioredoxin domain-containing protein [Bacteroidaceae bacterium]